MRALTAGKRRRGLHRRLGEERHEAEAHPVPALEALLVPGAKRDHRLHVDLVEGGQDGGGVLRLDETLRDPPAQPRHRLAALAAMARRLGGCVRRYGTGGGGGDWRRCRSAGRGSRFGAGGGRCGWRNRAGGGRRKFRCGGGRGGRRCAHGRFLGGFEMGEHVALGDPAVPPGARDPRRIEIVLTDDPAYRRTQALPAGSGGHIGFRHTGRRGQPRTPVRQRQERFRR